MFADVGEFGEYCMFLSFRTMRQTERAGIMRVVTDLIETDGILDTREMTFLHALRSKYGIQKEDEIMATSLSLAQALNELAHSDAGLRQDLLGDFTRMAQSDDFCSREEALLILAIRNCLTLNQENRVSVVSVNTASLNFEDAQILYVESEFDKDINEQINRYYREICAEIRLSGFDFVYLPKIAEHYQSISESLLFQITEFLYPKVSEDRLHLFIDQLRNLSTERFCKEQLAAKLNITELSSVVPSLMLKIGDSLVDNKIVANFLLVEIDGNVLECVRGILDLFTESYHNDRLNYLKEEKGRFVLKGFYKQIFDILMLRKGIQSRVVIDTFNDRIYFPDADVVMEKIHRREKALYALFLLESASGGINFNKPTLPDQLERYKKRMADIQAKYKMIYKMFGGEESAAPNLEISEIRLPMISLLKRQLLKLGDVLYHVDDYVIQRNAYGNYSVGISSDQCCCNGAKGDFLPLSESEVWKRISALQGCNPIV